MRIGELAKAADSDVETIRYYEKIGILPRAARSEGNYRQYTPAQVDRLRFVRHCRSLDMTLDEIRILLSFRDQPDVNCAEVNRVLDQHIGHVVERIESLVALEKELRKLRRQCRQAQRAGECGILAGLEEHTAVAKTARGHRHIAGAHK